MGSNSVFSCQLNCSLAFSKGFRLTGQFDPCYYFSKIKVDMLPSANVFLLTHKCGNNYIGSVFENDDTVVKYQADDMRGWMPGPYISSISDSLNADKRFLNLRCRNFNPKSIEKLLQHIDIASSRFYIFTRHPASFFRSAASYHLRGVERWSKKISSPF